MTEIKNESYLFFFSFSGFNWLAIVIGIACCGFVFFLPVACYCIGSKKRKSKQTNTASSLVSREIIEGGHLPCYPDTRGKDFLPSLSRRLESNSEVLQIVNPQSTSQRAPREICLPIRRERQVPTGNPLEVLMVELPPLPSRGTPPPPYSRSGEDLPPPYCREESPPVCSREEPSPPSCREHPSTLCSGEHLPSPYPGRQPSRPYAVTSLV